MVFYLLGKLWNVWTSVCILDRDIHTDDDDVRNTASYPNYEGPGQREGQDCVNTQRQEEEKRHLNTRKEQWNSERVSAAITNSNLKV